MQYAVRITTVLLMAWALGSTAATDPGTCPVATTPMSCSSQFSQSLSDTDGSALENYTCGEPFAPLEQTGPDYLYAFDCQTDGDVTLQLTSTTCDFDLYVLDDSCDTDTGCVAGDTSGGGDSQVTFICVAGQTYVVSVEGYGFTLSSGTGQCSGSESYILDVAVFGAGTGCPEDCNDGSDNDLDGLIDCDDSDCSSDPVCGTCDADGDGYDSADCGGTDCDDTDPNINPGADEVCDGIDNDCDGLVDDADSSVADASTYYLDADNDTYGSPSDSTQSCTQPEGYVVDGTDCNDDDETVHPGATELCDGQDNNCDAVIPDDEIDDDSDSYVECSIDTNGWDGDPAVIGGEDCNDTDGSIHPGAEDVCGDGVDSNCDGIGGPADDEDGDGCPWTDEDAAGTDACDEDSDDDRLSDGEEMGANCAFDAGETNPLDPDTDSDGASDGLEIICGSDPLDPNSLPSDCIIFEDGFELTSLQVEEPKEPGHPRFCPRNLRRTGLLGT